MRIELPQSPCWAGTAKWLILSGLMCVNSDKGFQMRAPITRRASLLGLSSLGLLQGLSWAQPAGLPVAKALHHEIAAAAHNKQALVVMVSLEGCGFCRIARQTQLLPRLRQGLPIVQVDLRSTSLLKDPAGVDMTHDALTRRWGIRIAPTLLFLGPGGTELAQRMEGAYQPDFYGAYLDERLLMAAEALRKNAG
jgi:hypothetical protein